MLRVLPAFIAVVLLVAALIDAAQTPESQVRNLQKWVWILIILVVPFAGPVAWFVAGRPQRSGPVTATIGCLADITAPPAGTASAR